MDRSQPRRVAVWNKRAPNMPVPSIPGETVVGSKIALFGCADAQALETIGKSELAEGLPHPLIHGVWPGSLWGRAVRARFLRSS